MRPFASVTWAVAWRGIRAAMSNPALILPTIIGPLIFFASLAGGLSGIGRAPGFDHPGGYTTFQFVFIVVQAATFNGVFLGFFVARDFEGGFARRLLLAAPHRLGIVAGYTLTAVVRSAASLSVLFGVGWAVGVKFQGSAIETLALVVMSMFITALASLWGTGVALRLRTVQAAPLMQIPVFVGLFLTPVFVPKDLLTGWLQDVARYNPFSVFLEAGRNYIAGRNADDLVLMAVLGALAIVLSLWASFGMQRAARAG